MDVWRAGAADWTAQWCSCGHQFALSLASRAILSLCSALLASRPLLSARPNTTRPNGLDSHSFRYSRSLAEARDAWPLLTAGYPSAQIAHAFESKLRVVRANTFSHIHITHEQLGSLSRSLSLSLTPTHTNTHTLSLSLTPVNQQKRLNECEWRERRDAEK